MTRIIACRPAGFKYLVTEMVCWATDGPQKYTGRTMRDSHQALMITAAEWQAFLDDFSANAGQVLRRRTIIFRISSFTSSNSGSGVPGFAATPRPGMPLSAAADLARDAGAERGPDASQGGRRRHGGGAGEGRPQADRQHPLGRGNGETVAAVHRDHERRREGVAHTDPDHAAERLGRVGGAHVDADGRHPRPTRGDVVASLEVERGGLGGVEGRL